MYTDEGSLAIKRSAKNKEPIPHQPISIRGVTSAGGGLIFQSLEKQGGPP
jgi:hypothetical protein